MHDVRPEPRATQNRRDAIIVAILPKLPSLFSSCPTLGFPTASLGLLVLGVTSGDELRQRSYSVLFPLFVIYQVSLRV